MLQKIQKNILKLIMHLTTKTKLLAPYTQK
jgi:hypothetical protein